MKILCAVDDTDHSRPAVRLAAKIAGGLKAELTLLAVNQALGGYVGGKPSNPMWSGADVQRILAAASEEARAAGAANIVTASVGSAEPAEAIVAFGKENAFDHIVVGSGGKGLAFRVVLGSVSRDVVQGAHCAVTVAR